MPIHLSFDALTEELSSSPPKNIFYLNELRDPSHESALEFWASIVFAAQGLGWVEICLEEEDASLSPDIERPQGHLITWTSGTTSAPKSISVRLAERLTRDSARVRSELKQTWLLTYDLGRWASISTLIHAWKTMSDVVIASTSDSIDLVDAAIATKVNCLGITPSLFRRWQIDFGDRLSSLDLRQLTFGGEWTSQKTLDAASEIWPKSRISHIYSTTETGDICSASDKIEGFPVDSFIKGERYLDQDKVLIVNGEYTGDIWSLEGERFKFQGRMGATINVGGVNVYPSAVEDAAIGIEGVFDVYAFSIPNALLGHVVGLDYVGTIEPKLLRATLAQALPRTSIPAQVKRVDEIPLGANGKKIRQA